MWGKLAQRREELERKRQEKQAQDQAQYLEEWRAERDAIQRKRNEAFANEDKRIRQRRRELGLRDVDSAGKWGLAISGGGIRSATSGLGVLQALARSDSPRAADANAKPADKSLLREFDYVSSVSGGGYIAGFFVSLFQPGRLIRGSSAVQAAQSAYRALRYEPPGRMHRHDDYADTDGDGVGRGPVAWLRENGRYLAPTGGGDMLYAAALTIRNWFSVQYVLGTLLIAVLSLLALIRAGFTLGSPGYASTESDLLNAALCDEAVWWSPLWILPIACLVLWIAPAATAFWLTHAPYGQSDRVPPNRLSMAARCTLGIGLLFAALTWAENRWYLMGWKELPLCLLLLATIALLGFATHAASVSTSPSISAHRVHTTRSLTKGFQWLLILSVTALADTLGQHLYLLATTSEDFWKSLTPGAAAGVIVWALRWLAGFFDEKKATGWAKLIPVNLLAGIAGLALLLLIITLWAVFVQWVQWTGAAPDVDLLAGQLRFLLIAGTFLLFLVLSLTSARFAGFLNLSTLQMLYGARLTRAYLGATNKARFEPRRDQSNRSAAEPISGDQIAREQYYDPAVLAPLHIINVTMNQTIDPAEQLVQRDRKGKPLAVTPGGFSIEGNHFDFVRSEASINSGKGSQNFTIGQWIGISGAAFTTGLGRSTSLGVSLALGLANVRLGMWWSSGYGRDQSKGLYKAFKALFRTQTFLIYEMLAMFHGLRREWQYLSDGGHYENTAAYELLRAERKVKLIVVCDNGCDPQYQFGDLANLIRLARIDYRMELEVNTDIARHEQLRRYFGVPAEFRTPSADAAEAADAPPPNEKCALLLDVFHDRNKAPGATPDCRIVLLKPRLLPSMPIDLLEYQKTHPAFPQEPTADQFFDEAQWESYRCLGYCIGRRIFGTDAPDEVGEALWSFLNQRPT